MAMSVDLIQGLSGGLAVKAPCRVATTANIALSGLQTIDGVSVVAGDRVLVKNQTIPADNGIYIASTSGWARSLDFNGSYDAVVGTIILVNEGTSEPTNNTWRVTAIGVIGTDDTTFGPSGESLRADLAASSGASLIGYLPAGTGAVETDVRTKLNEVASASNFPSLDAAFASHDTVYIPDNVSVTLSANWQPPRSGLRLYGQGRKSKLVFSGDNRRIHLVVSDFTIENLLIDGGKPSVGWETNNNYDYGVRIGEAVGARLSKLRFKSVVFKDIGLDGILVQNCEDVIIDDDCEFINCRRWGVAIIPGAHGVDNIKVGGYFDCLNGSGPIGKEYPLGAIDGEPDDGAHPGITNLTYGRVRSNAGAVCMLTYASSTTKSAMTDLFVKDADVRIDNLEAVIQGAVITGASGYLKADIAADGALTTLRKIDIVFDTGRLPITLASKRANLLPMDYGDDAFTNVGITSSGTGTSAGFVTRNIDGVDVRLREMTVGNGTGVYAHRHDLQATITAGDQVFLYFEIERTDSNTPNNNFFNVQLGGGALIDRLVLPPVGVSRYVIAFRADSTVVNPRLLFGMSGTPGAVVTCLVRKCFCLVNPEIITQTSITVRPANVSSVYVGTAVGLTTSPTGNIQYSRVGNIVTIHVPSSVFNGTSNSTGYSITGAPGLIRPTTAKVGLMRFLDNGVALTTPGVVTVETNGTLTFNKDCAGGAFTNTGSKGVFNSTVTYSLD